jgi:hypothetical protein
MQAADAEMAALGVDGMRIGERTLKVKVVEGTHADRTA